MMSPARRGVACPESYHVSCKVQRGEILAVAGVGQRSERPAEVILSLRTPDSGTITLEGKDTCANPRKLLNSGVGSVPEDRMIVIWYGVFFLHC